MDQQLRNQLAESEDRHWWFEGRRRILRSLLRLYGITGRILEVGCGNGANLEMLAEFGPVTAMEPHDGDRAMAAARGVGVVQPGSLPDGLGDGTWDVVLALDVIEHVSEDVASLRAMAGKLSAGGLLVITVPAFPWLWSEHDVVNGHVRRYTARSLEAAFHEAGLTPDRISYFNTLLFPIVAAVRMIGFGAAGTATPPRPINRVLTQLMGFESRLLRLTNLPVGVSLLATYRAPS